MLPILLVPMLLAPALPQGRIEEMENGRCPVTGQTIPQEPEFFVVVTLVGKARRYAVCCEHCVQELKRHPTKYLRKDGRPRNAKP